MRLWSTLPLALLLTSSLLPAASKKQPAKPQAATKPAAPKDNQCVDTPRIIARKRPVKKLELSESMRKELNGVLFGVSLNDRMEVNLDMQAPTDETATQLEKMVSLLASAEQLKTDPSETVVFDLTKSTRTTRNGKTVRTTISLTDAQLEKLLESRYGRKLVSEARMRLVYVHGMIGGTKTYPWGENITVNLDR